MYARCKGKQLAVVIIVVFLAVVSFINVVNSINEELGKVTQPNTKLGMFMWSLKRNRVDNEVNDKNKR